MTPSTNYIPCADFWMNMSIFKHKEFSPIRKVSIEKITIDKSRMAFPNEVDVEEVEYMLANFHVDAWAPIDVTSEYFLIDGQHRMEAARRMGLKFMDVVVIEETE